MSKLKAFIIFLIIIGISAFFVFGQISKSLPEADLSLIEAQIEEIKKEISVPPPLKAQIEALDSFLTQQGVVQWTNIQRSEYGLQPLRESQELNASAQAKLKDMFENGYFDHDSPSGIELKDLAKISGYEFINIGENLALGNFKNDQLLVQSWMDSPGHRANILDSSYQEIGVAVGRGTFEGKTTWMAVQHFALPLSVCPQPNKSIRERIEKNEAESNELLLALEKLKNEMESEKRKRDSLYAQKIEEYNQLVFEYNALIEETRILIYQYNNEIKLFNDCLSEI